MAAPAIFNLKARWQTWSARFAVMQPREKQMISAALAVAVLFGGYSLWIEPGQLQTTRLKKSLAQQQTEIEQLRAQVVLLVAQNQDPDAANRQQLGQLREQLSTAERDLKAFDRTLVAPAQAPALLQTLLARHRGLALVSLTTLPPQPLIDPAQQKAPKDAAKPAVSETKSQPAGNIYKHGIEIKLNGSYHDLLAYVSDIEASPQKLLWGSMRLAVKTHPISELTLTIYTLSLDATWLVV